MSEITHREISREEAQLWLHDRLGHEVGFDTRLDCGGHTVSVVSAVGELHHSSDEDEPPLVGAVGDVLRTKFTGLYSVGGSQFDPIGATLFDIGGEGVLPWRFSLRAARGSLTGSGDELVLSLRGCAEMVIGPPPRLPRTDDA